MKSKRKTLIIKIAIAIVYVSLIIGVEFAYRDVLFNKSIEIEVIIQRKISKVGNNYFKFITHFGELKVTFAFVALVFVFFSFTKSFTLVSVYIYGYYFTNLMKMMYHSPRPFWDNSNLNPTCNSGFGNPSGHSVTAFGLYFTLFSITTDFNIFKTKTWGKGLKIVIFIFYFLLILSIVISRIVLGAHGINQVIYGSLIGIAVYYIIYHIISYTSMTNIQFYEHLFNKASLISYFVIYASLLLLTLFFYLFGQVDVQNYLDLLSKLCPKKKEYQLLYHDGFIQSISITGLIGAHLGLLLLYYLAIKKYTLRKAIYINEWNQNGKISMFFIRLPINLFSIAFLLLYFIKSDYLWILFIFKSALSFGLGLFGVYGIGVYICLIIGKCNQYIYDANYSLRNITNIYIVTDENAMVVES